MKKRLFANLAVALLFCLTLASPLLPRAHALGNQIANADLSQQVNGQPTDWYTDNWGNLQASFSYLSEGQNDTSSARVTVSSYSDGDAKWYFTPVALSAGSTYTFSDYYRSDQTTNVWAQLKDQSGAFSYRWLGTDAPSTAWQQGSFTLPVPAGTVSGTVFHVLASNGYLDTDTFSLAEQTCSPTSVNGVNNGTLTQTCDNGLTPAGWQTARYGTNNATFQYLGTGYDDTRSIQTKISSYTSGEAEWYFAPQTTVANQRYRFTANYKSDTYSYAYVELGMADGSYDYIPLMSVPSPGSEWSSYDDVFVTPANTKTLNIRFAISSVGYLNVDNYRLTPLTNYADNKLSSPLVSINFDDGDANAYSAALPVLNTLGLKATFYVNGSVVGTSGFMTAAQVKALYTQGHEIGSHSYAHVDLVPLSATALKSQITNNQTKLKTITGATPTTFATPYGSYNSRVLDVITGTVPYVRDTDNAINHKYNFNPRTIHAKDVTSSMTVADINALVAQAKQQGGWLVLVYHNVAASGDEYTVSKSTLQQQLQAIKSSGVTIETNQQAINQIKPQL